MGTYDYDLVVIGTGPGSGAIPFKCKKAGWSVAVVENLPIGGTCALRGCTPKKLFLAAPEAWDFARRMFGSGFMADSFQLNWPEMKAHTDEFIDKIPAINEKNYKDKGIDVLKGTASFTGPNELSIDGKKVTAGKIVIATGTTPRPLKFHGAEHVHISDEFFNLQNLPDRIVFIGGGYISMEFAHIAARCGSEVTVIQRGKRILKEFDADMVGHIHRVSENHGIRILTDSEVNSVEKSGDEFIVQSTHTDHKKFACDAVFHGAGRIPNIDVLNLKAGNVSFNARGIEVDDYLQNPTNENVYAAGDCADNGAADLTPPASLDSVVIAEHLIGDQKQTKHHVGVPSVAFTIPQIASVGMSEEEAKATGKELVINTRDKIDNFQSFRINGEAAAYKVIIDRESKQILGAHLVGYEAAEVINIFALAIQHNLTADDIRFGYYTYPSHTAEVREMTAVR